MTHFRPAFADRRLMVGAGLILLAGAIVQLLAFWPGIMVWDAIRQYGQALSGRYDDWHPPAMNWLWRQLGRIAAGPAPMLALQALLYWSGFALLILAAARRGRSGTALVIAACALLPIPFVLVGTILKDSLMAGTLLVAAGLIGLRRPGDRWLGTGAALILIATATLRFNAVAACLPLLVTLAPDRWKRTRLRFALTMAAAAVPLVIAMPIANRLLHAQPSGVQLSLIIYDLGGIGRYSGSDAFPPVPVERPAEVNAHCYSPISWDSYAWWVDAPCPIGFATVRAAFEAHHIDPYRWWLEALIAHPIAYVRHRLAHFDRNTHFMLADDASLPGLSLHSDPNDWGYQVPPSRLRATIGTLAEWTIATPLGWPICWIALGIGALFLLPLIDRNDPARAVLWSALLYAFSYLPLSVASEIRYHFWTMTAVAIAWTSIIAALARGGTVARWRFAAGLLPFAIVTMLAVASRLIG
ncbi:hypothetical protein [Flavisphingomonas formosensis]|uniref:hypothetical protein n=1 Tax=Flavisphingomonas formosensis TaxID=861534 RepID=UPI001E5B0581|nr:hypothetical protein [Sphingomonas formosensis]